MSYKIEFNEAKKQVEIELKTLIDNASLITPQAFMKDGVPQGAPKFSIRCLLKADKCGQFQKDLIASTSRLCDGKAKVHERLAMPNVTERYLVKDFFKIGSEIIAEKKENDLHAKKGSKKKYSTAIDYLEDLCYFYASTSAQYPVKIFNECGRLLQIDDDKFFEPSFIGKVRLVVKLNEKFGSPTPDLGGQLTAYLQGVQFIETTKINYRQTAVAFEATDTNDNMFGDTKDDVQEDLGFYTREDHEKAEIKINMTKKEFDSNLKNSNKSYLVKGTFPPKSISALKDSNNVEDYIESFE